VSFNDEGFLSREQIESMLNPIGPVAIINHDHPRYVGCKIGIHNQRGEKVGRVGRVRNTEHFFIAGEGAEMFIEQQRAVAAAG
jgi:adenine-specific DNA-methyltransferase